MTTVIVIGAVSQDGVYGIGDSIPWKISADMKHFKEVTAGQTVVMGRGTWESLPPKFRPLPGRINIVITNTSGYVAEGALIMTSIQQAIERATTEKVFLIGGHRIWCEGAKIADEMVITIVLKDVWVNEEGVHLAPELLDPPSSWRMQRYSSIPLEGAETPCTVEYYRRGYGVARTGKVAVEGHLE